MNGIYHFDKKKNDLPNLSLTKYRRENNVKHDKFRFRSILTHYMHILLPLFH